MSHSLTHCTGACVAIALLATMAAQAASAGPWTVSADAGVSVSDYVARHDGYEQAIFGPTWTLSGEVARALGDRIALRLASGYLRTVRSVAIISVPEVATPDVRQMVELVPLGLGVRVFLVRAPARPGGPYIELTPALYWMRVSDRWSYDGWDFSTGARKLRVEKHAVERFLPGLDAAIGVEGRVAPHVQAGLSLHEIRTAAFGDVTLGGWRYGRYRGLRQLAMSAGLSWAP